MITTIFHRLSSLKYPMFLMGAIYAFPELFHRTTRCIDHVGLGLFFFGLGLSLDGLKADRAFSRREIQLFVQPKRFKSMLGFTLFFAGVTFLLGVFFFAAPLLFPGMDVVLVEKLKGVGLGSFSFGIGQAVMEKQRHDRFLAYWEGQSQKGEALSI